MPKPSEIILKKTGEYYSSHDEKGWKMYLVCVLDAIEYFLDTHFVALQERVEKLEAEFATKHHNETLNMADYDIPTGSLCGKSIHWDDKINLWVCGHPIGKCPIHD